jgi:hypothetical protein
MIQIWGYVDGETDTHPQIWVLPTAFPIKPEFFSDLRACEEGINLKDHTSWDLKPAAFS